MVFHVESLPCFVLEPRLITDVKEGARLRQDLFYTRAVVILNIRIVDCNFLLL